MEAVRLWRRYLASNTVSAEDVLVVEIGETILIPTHACCWTYWMQSVKASDWLPAGVNDLIVRPLPA